jgi:hypothetical protein
VFAATLASSSARVRTKCCLLILNDRRAHLFVSNRKEQKKTCKSLVVGASGSMEVQNPEQTARLAST